MEEMLYHTRAVVRAKPSALVVSDMPFLSYQVDLTEARRNAGRLVKDGGAEAVKLEGGENVADTIRAIVAMDVPVVGHIGLTVITSYSIHYTKLYESWTNDQSPRLCGTSGCDPLAAIAIYAERK